MASVIADAPVVREYVYYRHTLPVRIMHWVNVVALTIMVGSGLRIAIQAQRAGRRRKAQPGHLILPDAAAALGRDCQRSDNINRTGILPCPLCSTAAPIGAARNQ